MVDDKHNKRRRRRCGKPVGGGGGESHALNVRGVTYSTNRERLRVEGGIILRGDGGFL